MRLHLPCSLRKSVLSSLVSMVALSLGSGSASAVTESEPQNLIFNGPTLTWNTNTENKAFTNAAGESASFATGDNVTFASDATASLGEDISAGQINIANGADVVIELADNGLNFDTLSMLGGSLDAGDSLNIAAGETLAVGSNGSVLKSDLVLGNDARLSVDYAGAGSATSLNNSALSLQGGTRLQLSGCGNGDGKTYTLLAGISELKDAQGNTISLGEGNNAISSYFDTSQPGTGFWANGTLQLNDGTLQLVLHDQEVKDSVQIITRQTDELTYQYYAEVTFDGIEHTASNQGGAICGNNNISISNNGSVKFRENMLSSSSGYYSFGGAVYGKGNITINSNGYVEFSRNKVAHEQEATGGAIQGRGSIILCDNGYVNFIENSVVSNYHACGAAILSTNNLELNDNTSLIFSGNSAYTYHDNAVGGAIYGASGITTINNNGHLEFSNNTAYTTKDGSSGGAIFGRIITLSGNNDVRFSGNAVYAESSNYSRIKAEGGAIVGMSSVTLSDNGTVEFRENKAFAETGYWAEAYGGAISGRASSTIALNDNGVVSFSGNEVAAHDTYHSAAYAYGAAIYGNASCDISLNNNKIIEFEENTNTSSAHWSSAYGRGGAVYGGSSSNITLNNNESVALKGNSVISFATSDYGSAYAYGGAVYGQGNITLSNNGSVEFCANTVSSLSSFGGAIYTDGSLNIRNNDSVLFEKNAEKASSNYCLRSVYVAGGNGDILSLSAAAGRNIEFRDSLYAGAQTMVKLNEAYEGMAQQGDIIFTGAYTEKHLNEFLATEGENRKATEDEIRRSLTSEVYAMTNLYGGRLRVEDGAIYKGHGITAHEGSEATVRVKDATLNHCGYDLTLYAGTTLELAGRSSIIGTVQMHGDSRLVFDLGESQETTTVYGAMNLEGILSVSARGDYIGDNVILLYVEDGISGWNGNVVSSDGKSYTVMCGDMLVANYNAESFLPYFRGDYEVTNPLSDGCKMNHYKSVQGAGIGESVISGGAVELNYNGSVEFSGNTANAGGAIYGDYDNTISLRDNGSVIFCRNRAELGGAIYRNSGMTELCHNKSVTFIGNSASASSSTPEIIGGAIYGQADITLSNNGSVEFIGNTVSGASSVFGGAIGWGGNLNIVDNESVIFEKNSAISSGFSVCGGAIYTFGNLSIRNNDLVEFYQNTEVRNGFYRLRSIYTEGYRPDEIFLSAAAGKSIIFRDSIYIDSYASFKLNEVYKEKPQQGDIIFTGATTVDDLYIVKGNVAGTEEEILLSRTTEVNAMTNLYGGRLRVEDGAIYKGHGITAHADSDSTVRVKDATLNHTGYELHFFEGTTLETLGESEIFGDVIVESTATAAFSALTRLEGSLTLASDSELSLDGELTLNGTLTLGLGLTLSGDILTDIKNLAAGQSITLVSGLESLTVQMQTLMRSLEYTTVMTGQELVAADYFSNLQTDSGYVLIYNGATGALTVTQSIPEPTTATLSLLALAALAVRRRRK